MMTNNNGPLSGQMVGGGKYQLGELLGEGGFGEVYKAQNMRLNRPQAIKVISEHLRDPQFRERFDREARTLASLSHDNILHVDDYELEGNRAYLVMPYIGGGTLKNLMGHGTFSLEQTGYYLRQISAALDYAHAKNVIHLDLKPLNLLHEKGKLLLSDFGLAHLMSESSVRGGTSLTFGTPHYMAPEHLAGKPERASDIYALGVMLFQMLTGDVPFDGLNGFVIMQLHFKEPPPSVNALRPNIPVAVDSVIARAMAKSAADRYSSAGALFNDFRTKAGLSSLPILQPPNATMNAPITPLPVSPSSVSSRPLTPLPPLYPSGSLVPPVSAPLMPPVTTQGTGTNTTGPIASPPPQMPISGQNSTGALSGSLESIAQYSQVQLDMPPSLEVMNHILQEVGKRAQQRKRGGNAG